jgi:hypothetical protein
MTRTCRGVNPAAVDRAQKSGFPARGTAAAVPAKINSSVFSRQTTSPPFFNATPMGDGCRPGHRKDAFILHGEVELQVLASVVGVSLGAGIGSPLGGKDSRLRHAAILLSRFRNQ